MALQNDWAALAGNLKELLGLAAAPIAITFTSEVPEGTARYAAAMPDPTPDGRTGAVPAGCVFWTKATERTFATVPDDHGNCSVGSLTHGLKTLDEAAQGADVAALVESEWVRPEDFPNIPTVQERPGAIIYGPLKETLLDPDVVFVRLTAKQAMVLHDSCPDIRLEGKPQCHVIPIAKESGDIALGVGCMLSRVRTGMSNNEMTCAIPASRLAEVVERVRTASAADVKVAAYASEDMKRFA